MARQRFIDWVIHKLPNMMQTPELVAFAQSFMDQFDALEYRADQAVKQRLPDFAGAHALDAIGAERTLPRYAAETSPQYAARLKTAWRLWAQAGTPTGLLRAITGMGYPNVHVICANGMDHSLDGSLNLVTTRGAPLVLNQPGWNHFLLVFRASLVTPWQTTIPISNSEEANRIRKAVRRWKWGNASFDGVLIENGGGLWGYPPTETWGGGGLTWGSGWVYWPPVDGLTWGYPTAQTWGGGLQWGIPVPSTDE